MYRGFYALLMTPIMIADIMIAEVMNVIHILTVVRFNFDNNRNITKLVDK